MTMTWTRLVPSVYESTDGADDPATLATFSAALNDGDPNTTVVLDIQSRYRIQAVYDPADFFGIHEARVNVRWTAMPEAYMQIRVATLFAQQSYWATRQYDGGSGSREFEGLLLPGDQNYQLAAGSAWDSLQGNGFSDLAVADDSVRLILELVYGNYSPDLILPVSAAEMWVLRPNAEYPSISGGAGPARARFISG